MPSPVINYLPEGRDSFIACCGLCGFPLTVYQVSADFSGHIVNYETHITVPCSFCLCGECLAKLIEYTNGGPDEAYRRIYVASVLTKQAYDEVDEYLRNTTEEE